METEKSDRELLGEFVASGSNRTFEALVQRHAGMVFGAALRVTRSRELAEDTAQLVFAIMLRKARALVGHPSLAAWLHKSATLEASRIMRKERNHQRKLKKFASSEAAAAQGDEISGAPDHPAMEHLDEAMALLRPGDRQFLMLRFYQGYKLRELAPVLGKSEAAVKKQSERAISRLSKILRKRGVMLSGMALAGILPGAFVQPVQAGLVATITSNAAATSASLTNTTLILNTLQTMSQGKQIALTAAAVALLAAIPVEIQTHRLKETKAELHEAQAQAVMVKPSSSESIGSKTDASRPPSAPPTADPDSLRAKAAASGTTDTQFLRDLLMRQERPPYEEIAAFIGEKRSLAELRSMFDEVVDLPLSEHQRNTLRKLVMEIGRHDGPHAVELANSIKASKMRHHALASAYAGWGSTDPAAAWAFATALPPEQRANHPYWQIMVGAAQGDLSAREFYDFVESHDPALVQLSSGHLWQALQFVYHHKDSRGMPSWIEGLPEGSLKNLASNQLVQRWALADPVAAREWMEANVDPHKNWEPAFQLAVGWAQVDPHAAMDWLTSLPRELQTKQQYHHAFEKWLSYDQVGAAKWLAEAEPSPMLDIPFERYVLRVRHRNPPEAMNWALEITDSERRLNMMKKVAEVWRSKDPAALEQFLASEDGASLR